MSECPALVPPNPPTTNTYNLHVNLSTDSRPQLLLRTRNIWSLTVMFDQRLFHCVVCLDHCGSEDDVIFRLEARVVAGNGRDTWIDCQGETVSSGSFRKPSDFGEKIIVLCQKHTLLQHLLYCKLCMNFNIIYCTLRGRIKGTTSAAFVIQNSF